MDSTIRLRQLNQAELSGFVMGLFSLLPEPNISGGFLPSQSGVFNIGSSSFPYSKAYFNELNLHSGSGINFGATSFRAYTSGSNAYLNIGGIIISSSGENIYIQGPVGDTGPSGHSGVAGPTGIGVTGIWYNTSNNHLYFGLSNNTVTNFNFQGLSGATGTSITGFFQSGEYIYPQFDNFKGSGAPIKLLAGPVGPPGSIFLNFFSGVGSDSVDTNIPFPSGVTINPYFYSSYGPPISFMRGMAYTCDSSGLNTHKITAQDTGLMGIVFSGQTIPFQVGDSINYYENSGTTGYWRFSLFPLDTPTGILFSSEINPEYFVEVSNTGAYGTSLINNLYRTQVSFTAGFTAQDHYRYGFMTYSLGEDTVNDVILTTSGYAYVVGEAYFSSGVGPIGPTGGPGPTGNDGPIGPSGDRGYSVVSYDYSGAGNSSYIRFVFSDGTRGSWVPLPSGGPSGTAGPAGSISNHFSGDFIGGHYYPNETVVTYLGSSFINTGLTPTSNVPPASPWQMLAASGTVGSVGGVGPTGPAGSISNHFSGEFIAGHSYPNDYIVTSYGSSYVNTGTTTTNVPPASPWQLLAKSGSIGPQGIPGVPTLLRNNSWSGNYYQPSQVNLQLDVGNYELFDILITGGTPALGTNGINVSFSWGTFATGKSIVLKIRNSGATNLSPPLFTFSGVNDNNATPIKWPNSFYPRPDDGVANIYTIIKFPDEFGQPAVYGTYSNPYF